MEDNNHRSAADWDDVTDPSNSNNTEPGQLSHCEVRPDLYGTENFNRESSVTHQPSQEISETRPVLYGLEADHQESSCEGYGAAGTGGCFQTARQVVDVVECEDSASAGLQNDTLTPSLCREVGTAPNDVPSRHPAMEKEEKDEEDDEEEKCTKDRAMEMWNQIKVSKMFWLLLGSGLLILVMSVTGVILITGFVPRGRGQFEKLMSTSGQQNSSTSWRTPLYKKTTSVVVSSTSFSPLSGWQPTGSVTDTHRGNTEILLTTIAPLTTTDCQLGDGSTYRGTVSVTESGLECQHWDSQRPHKHDYTARKYPSADFTENYCRNPSHWHEVWCFTTARRTRWERCDIPFCGIKDVNVALGKTAFQTSTYKKGVADLAVDGNTDTNYCDGCCTHTLPEKANPCWWVDLGYSYMVDRVVIFNRRGPFWKRLNPFNIHIGDSTMVSQNPKCGDDHHINVKQRSISVSCQGMKGRYVGVRLPGPSRILTLCEVLVFLSHKPTSCAEAKSLRSNANDGEYILYPFSTDSDVALRVYCHDMASGTPNEFLALPSGPEENYAIKFGDQLVRENAMRHCAGPLRATLASSSPFTACQRHPLHTTNGTPLYTITVNGTLASSS
uniref:Kringle domain-containing protein n=1 Tax=Branchiostoma floridae TaxID=7739 RepID=C3Z829_BRAFL|eukprot:XP_002595331.1 hypothetical protein BRAFLDRAFT_87568 [Branchiostoma floridae]